MNYKVVCDEKLIEEFISYLPDLEKTERYYIHLFGRKKYSDEVSSAQSSELLKRTICKKEDILSRLRQMECPVGAYTSRGLPIPQEALAVFITCSPRCLSKAALAFAKELVGALADGIDGYNIYHKSLTSVHKARARKTHVDFDIDTKEDGILDKVQEIIPHKNAYKIIETRGGYHVWVDLRELPANIDNQWYVKLKKISDVCGDNMMPIPGTYQGGFMPKFVEI